jgi:hypothetical protein
MSEVNNISVENVEIPVDSYIERLNSKLEEFSSTMSVDTEDLTNEPKGGSWEEVEQYLKCIRITEEQPESIILPYWGSVQLPTPEELAEPNTEEYTPEDVLGRLFVVNAALNVEFDYYNKDTSKEESMTLDQLIGDVYPGLEDGVKEIRKELEFAFRNPEGFKKKYSEKERNIGGLTRRAFIKKGVEVTAASLFVLTSMSLASCSSKQVQTEPTAVVETYTSTAIKTEEPTPTPTETQESSPTPTETQEPSPTPTPTPIIEGDISPFLEKGHSNVEVVKNMLTLQEIINNYNPESDLDFGEYISSKKQEFESNTDNGYVTGILEDLEEYDKINTLILARVIHENIPELGIINIEDWSEDKVVDILPQFALGLVEILRSEEEEVEDGFRGGDYLYDGFITIGEIPQDFYIPGDLVFSLNNYDPSDKNSDLNLFIVISRVEDSISPKFLAVTIREGGKMVLIEINKDNLGEIFGEDIIILMGGSERISSR